MYGPKTIGLAVDGGLEDVVAAGVDEAAADERDGRDLVELRQLANRVEHDDVGARLGVDGQLGSRRTATALAPRDVLDLGEPVRADAARRSAAPTASRSLIRRNARSTGSSSPRIVLPATITRRSWATPEEAQHAIARRGPAASVGGGQRGRVELQAAGDGHPRRLGADLHDATRRLVALHAEAIDVGEHAAEAAGESGDSAERPRRDASVHDERFHVAPRHSRSRFGQISPSIRTNRRGRTQSSSGARRTRSRTGSRRPVGIVQAALRASCCPAVVVVETNSRSPG